MVIEQLASDPAQQPLRARKLLSLIVPAFNEERRIAKPCSTPTVISPPEA
jgi:hypothetical protein